MIIVRVTLQRAVTCLTLVSVHSAYLPDNQLIIGSITCVQFFSIFLPIMGISIFNLKLSHLQFSHLFLYKSRSILDDRLPLPLPMYAVAVCHAGLPCGWFPISKYDRALTLCAYPWIEEDVPKFKWHNAVLNR